MLKKILFKRDSKLLRTPVEKNQIKEYFEARINIENSLNRYMNFYDKDKWQDILLYEIYPYKYITNSGEIQECLATIRVTEREWRWKWFNWLKYPRKICRDIDVEFSEEIGEKKGSWKGGCVGCAYQMKKGETPYQTLMRMEKERRFT